MGGRGEGGEGSGGDMKEERRLEGSGYPLEHCLADVSLVFPHVGSAPQCSLFFLKTLLLCKK